MREEVERVAVEERGRDVGRAARPAPRHVIGAGDVSLGAIEPDGQERPLVVAAADEYHVAAGHWRSDDVGRKPAAFPQDLAGGEIVATHAIRAADHDLRPAAVLDHDGRGPRGDLVALELPSLFARSFVQRDDKGLAFVVPVDDQRVAVKRR